MRKAAPTPPGKTASQLTIGQPSSPPRGALAASCSAARAGNWARLQQIKQFGSQFNARRSQAEPSRAAREGNGPTPPYCTAIDDEESAGTAESDFVSCASEVRQLLSAVQAHARRLPAHLELLKLAEWCARLPARVEALSNASEVELMRLPNGGGAIFTLRCFLRHAQRSVELIEAWQPERRLQTEGSGAASERGETGEENDGEGEGEGEGEAEAEGVVVGKEGEGREREAEGHVEGVVYQELAMIRQLTSKLVQLQPLVICECDLLSDMRQGIIPLSVPGERTPTTHGAIVRATSGVLPLDRAASNIALSKQPSTGRVPLSPRLPARRAASTFSTLGSQKSLVSLTECSLVLDELSESASSPTGGKQPVVRAEGTRKLLQASTKSTRQVDAGAVDDRRSSSGNSTLGPTPVAEVRERLKAMLAQTLSHVSARRLWSGAASRSPYAATFPTHVLRWVDFAAQLEEEYNLNAMPRIRQVLPAVRRLLCEEDSDEGMLELGEFALLTDGRGVSAFLLAAAEVGCESLLPSSGAREDLLSRTMIIKRAGTNNLSLLDLWAHTPTRSLLARCGNFVKWRQTDAALVVEFARESDLARGMLHLVQTPLQENLYVGSADLGRAWEELFCDEATGESPADGVTVDDVAADERRRKVSTREEEGLAARTKRKMAKYSEMMELKQAAVRDLRSQLSQTQLTLMNCLDALSQVELQLRRAERDKALLDSQRKALRHLFSERETDDLLVRIEGLRSSRDALTKAVKALNVEAVEAEAATKCATAELQALAAWRDGRLEALKQELLASTQALGAERQRFQSEADRRRKDLEQLRDGGVNRLTAAIAEVEPHIGESRRLVGNVARWRAKALDDLEAMRCELIAQSAELPGDFNWDHRPSASCALPGLSAPSNDAHTTRAR